MEKNGVGVRKGAWTKEEDLLLKNCIHKFGEGRWHLVPLRAGLKRCRKSCRLRWLNYLRPNLKRGYFSKDEVDLVVRLHKLLGNRWSLIAGRLPGRTANDVKNFWNTHISKKPSSSREKTITKSNIVRPRPRTFSDSHRPAWSTELARSSIPIVARKYDEDPTKKASSSSSSSSPSPSSSSLFSVEKAGSENIPVNVNALSLEEDLDECIKWWGNLLDMAENGGEETQFWNTGNGQGITEPMLVCEGGANHEGFQLK